MAYFDSRVAMLKNSQKEKYEELKKFITSKDDTGKVSEWYPAWEHLMMMETHIKEMTARIDTYKEFFKLLDVLLPRRHSIYDKIG